MIEIVETCHRRARLKAMERNSNRPVFLVSCFRHGDRDQIRFVFRTSSTGGCN